MSSPQFPDASKVFRKPVPPPPKPTMPTRPVAPAQGGLRSDKYAVGVFTPAPQASQASVAPEVITGRPAGFWIRAGARLVDAIFLTVVQFAGAFGIFMVWGDGDLTVQVAKGFNTSFHVLYFIFCHAWWGQTIGKMTFKIKVVMVEGFPISLMTSIKRSLGEILSALTLGIGYLMAGLRSDKRALHDLVAKTCVVRL